MLTILRSVQTKRKGRSFFCVHLENFAEYLQNVCSYKIYNDGYY